MRGCSPFDNTLLLKQITETLILIALKVVQRFTLWFTPTVNYPHKLLVQTNNAQDIPNAKPLIINKLYSEAGSFQRRQPLEDADS